MLAAMTAAPARRTLIPRTLTLVGLGAMAVLAGFAFRGFTYESGDSVYFFFLAEAIVGAVTTLCAIWWVVWAQHKAVAITLLVLSVVINPIWLFLLILLFSS